MKKSILFVFCLIMFTCAFSQEREVKYYGVKYRIDLKNKTASVGSNYRNTLSGSIKGTAKGIIEIKPYVYYQYESYPVESIDDYAFLACDKITSIFFPASINNIKPAAFVGLYSLMQINVDQNNSYLKSVDGILYSKSSKTIIRYPPAKIDISFQIPSTVKYIAPYAFHSCSNIKELFLPDSLVDIGEEAFRMCDFDHLLIPDNTESIGDCAFSLCNDIKSIKLPYKVKKVGSKAFEYCSNLEKFIYQNDELEIPSDAFTNCSKLDQNSIVYEAPISSFLNLAQQGVLEYQFKIGVCYLKGYNYIENVDSALFWLNKSAENGYLQSQLGLGIMYYNGGYVDRDIKKGVYWLTMAAEGGSSEAQYMLGNHFYSGIYENKNSLNALNFYQQAANNGYEKAEGMLASLYFYGDENIEPDYNKAFMWYQKAAEHGDTLSFYNLGVCYNEGLGTQHNNENALLWVEKAFKSGNEKAKTLYLSLLNSDAEEKMNNSEYDNAIERFSEVLTYDENNVDCLINRGYCYLNLKDKDYNKAKADFEKVMTIDMENIVARNNLNIVNDYFQRVEEANRLCNEAYNSYISGDYVNAITYCSQSISLDDSKPYPYYLIGYCYSINSLYYDAIRFYDMALTLDPSYTDAIKARKSAKTMAILTTITQALTVVSNSLNAAYSSSVNYGTTYQSSSQSDLTKSETAGGFQHITCSYCHGTGYDPYPSYAPTFGYERVIKDERCDICGKFESHYHKKCPSCGGKGYTKKFVH